MLSSAAGRSAKTRFNWRLTLYAALGSAVMLGLYASSDLGITFYSFLAPFVCLFLLTVAIRKRSLSALLGLAVFCAVSWALVQHPESMRSRERWLLKARGYKAEVLKQPASAKGELKHVEWDGWGGFGAGDTVEYLVFDPDDSLARPAESKSSGKFPGLPCEVAQVHRLESHWYYLLFYTDTDWEHCA